MKQPLKVVGTFLLGLIVVALTLGAFSPIGRWACYDCEEIASWSWVLLGIVGIMASVLIVGVIVIIYAIGNFTVEQADEVKWAYHRRQHRLRDKPMPKLPGEVGGNGYDIP